MHTDMYPQPDVLFHLPLLHWSEVDLFRAGRFKLSAEVTQKLVQRHRSIAESPTTCVLAQIYPSNITVITQAALRYEDFAFQGGCTFWCISET